MVLLGHPVGHSLSPSMQSAALQAVGLTWTYELRDVPPARLALELATLRADPDWRGGNLTIPHKEAVLPLLDAVDATARAIGAVNTMVRAGDRVWGYNTDAMGFLRDLEEHGVETASLAGETALVLGAGGAARAVAFALAQQAMRLVIVNRTLPRARRLVDDLNRHFGAGTAAALGTGAAELYELFPGCRLVINATSAGMPPQAHLDPLPAGCRPQSHQIWYDLIYRPPVTPFLRRAAGGGARAIGGLGMLLHQGAAAFELWTGRPAPLAPMRAALIRALSATGETGGGMATPGAGGDTRPPGPPSGEPHPPEASPSTIVREEERRS